MKKLKGRTIYIIGIADVLLYFAVVGLFLITQTDIALTLWELVTVLSGPVILSALLQICNDTESPKISARLTVSFMSCVCALTGAAHIVNISVTRRLIKEGVDVPLYFQIGQWPSVEMAVDYLAWGFFMGLSFLSLGICIKSIDKKIRLIKVLILICGILCLIGFGGSVFINENIWYTAPLGYGPGFLILCILMLNVNKDFQENKRNN